MKAEMMENKCVDVAQMMKIIAHPQRLMILCHLSDSEKSVSELLEVIEISQSQLSQFLNRMHREKLLHMRKDGQFAYYSIDDKKVSKLIQSLQKIYCEI
jgi:DNA-binding transcriptional ArsR family regulator